MPRIAWVGALGVLFVAGCFTPDPVDAAETSTGSDAQTTANPTTDSCALGTVNCPCSGTTCDPGLQCESGLCVPESVATTQATTPMTSDTGGTTEATTDPGGSSSSSGPSAASSSSSESTATELCGNGDVDEGEECDSSEGCTDECELTDYECHPLLQSNCPAGSQCIWDLFDSDFTCAAEGDVVYGGTCTSIENLFCEPGLICVNAANFPNCLDSACCSNYCDTDNGDADCFAPLQCISFWQVGFGEKPGVGLPNVGICLTP